MAHERVRAAQALKPGARLSHYRVESRIGSGGMGTVYLARDSRLDRDVAVKVINPDIAADPDRLARFHREARTIAQLTHPGIVTIHDTGQEDGVTFIVTEFVQGTTLRDVLLREGALGARRVIDIGAQVADALAAAHDAGITHRDVKPENVMLTSGGRAKLLDFGLARAGAATRDTDSVITAWTTEKGTILGTPGYTSPEQLRGAVLDARSDIFSLGIVLYEMAGGTRPFMGATPADISGAVLRGDPSPLPETTPAALRVIIERCLEKEPARRFQSASDLAFALTSLGTRSSAALDATHVPPARSRWWPGAALAVAGVLAGIALAAARLAGTRPVPMTVRPFATDTYGESQPVWAPDGRAIVYAAAAEGKYRLQAKFLQAPGATTLLQCPAICEPFAWTPDGSRVLYLSRTTHLDAHVWSIAPTGGAPEPMFRADVQVLAASLSPDGRQLALLQVFELPDKGGVRHRLYLSSPPGATPVPVDVFPRLHLIQPSRIAWSVDSTHLLVVTSGPSAARVVWPAEKRMTQFALDVPLEPSFWTDGTFAVAARRALGARPGLEWLDTRSGRFSPLMSSESKLTGPAVAPDGSRVAYVTNETDYDVVQIPLDGSGVQPLLTSRLDEHSVAFSPKGDEFAYVAAGQAPEIRIRQPLTLAERVAVSQSDHGNPAPPVRFSSVTFSPDATRLAYNKNFQIWISPSNGGPPAKLTRDDGEFGPEWSPDGQWIAFTYAKPTWGGLVKVRVGGDGTLVRLRPGEGGPVAPAWSPDGAWIAYGREPKGLDLVPADGGAPVSLGDEYLPFAVWARDSQHLYVVRVEGERRELGELEWRRRAFRRIGPFPADVDISNGMSWAGRISLSPDGRCLATAVVRRTGDIWILEGLRPPRTWWQLLRGQ